MKKIIPLLILLLWSSLSFAAPKGNTQYFGNNSNVVFHLDMQRLQKGETPKNLLGMLMMNPKTKEGLNKFKTQFGLDPFKDIQSLTGSVTLMARGTEPLILLHIQGTFNEATFLKGLTQEGNDFKTETINGHTLHVSTANKSALSFIKGGVLMGSPDQLRAAVKGTTFAGGLVAQQAKLTNGGDLWFVAQFPEAMRKEMQLKNPAMANASALRGFIDFEKGLHVSLITELDNAEEATKAATQLNASINQAKGSPQAAMFINMINKFSANAKGNELVIDLPLNQDEVNQVQAIAGMLMMSLTANQGNAGGRAPSFPGLKGPVSPGAPMAPPRAPKLQLTPTPAK
jgi:hypothetical protein